MPEESKLAEKLENQTKFSDEDLKTVKEIQNEYSSITSKFGHLSISKIKLESQLRKEIEEREKKRKIPSWMIMKQVAQEKAREGNTKELNDLLNIERKMKKKSHTAQRREPNKTVPAPTIPLNFDGYTEFSKIKSKPDTTLKRLEAERNKPDPDFFKGLGIFFSKKF